jgi:hypothetical protein
MRALVSLLRTTVIVLLTVRVLASPITVRPADGSSNLFRGLRVVARFCSWPAVRPQRSISATSLVHRSRGGRRVGFEGRARDFRPMGLPSSDRVLTSMTSGHTAQDCTSSRPSLYPRC